MRIGIVGDSQSEGLAPWLIPLLEAQGHEVVGEMLVRGMSIKNLRSDPDRVRRAQLIAEVSDVLLVILGGNNHVMIRSSYERQMEWFLESIGSRTGEIWWVGPAATRHPEKLHLHYRTREYQKSWLPRHGVRWIDAWWMTANGVEFAPDQLHLTRAGYRVFARRLAAELEPEPWGTYLGAALLGVAGGLFAALRWR